MPLMAVYSAIRGLVRNRSLNDKMTVYSNIIFLYSLDFHIYSNGMICNSEMRYNNEICAKCGNS